MSKHLGTFSEVVRLLKKSLPPSFPISARRIFGIPKDRLGDCDLIERNGNKKFLIRITRKIDNDLAILILLHEWAHALCWQENTKIDLNDHGPEWGVAYSRVWHMFDEYLST